MSFDDMRLEFLRDRLRVPSLPITGAIVYATVAIVTLMVVPSQRNLALFIGFWTIMPLGAGLMKLRGDPAGCPNNPLFRLSVLARWMVMATWAIHLPVWAYAPAMFSLTVGIAFALHWIVMGWILQTSIGVVHLVLRTTLVLTAWHLWPDNRVGAVCAAVSVSYVASIIQFGLMQPVLLSRYDITDVRSNA